MMRATAQQSRLIVAGRLASSQPCRAARVLARARATTPSEGFEDVGTASSSSPSPSTVPAAIPPLRPAPKKGKKGGRPQLPDFIEEVEYLKTYRPNVGLCVVHETKGLVFAARRVDDDSGAWQMPQGGIDKGEEPRTAALRELEEETGIKPEHVEVVGELDEWLSYEFPTSVRKKFKKKVYRGQTQKWFLLKFTGAEEDIDLAARGEEHREFSEWCWLPLGQVSTEVVHFKREVYRQVNLKFAPAIDGGL